MLHVLPLGTLPSRDTVGRGLENPAMIGKSEQLSPGPKMSPTVLLVELRSSKVALGEWRKRNTLICCGARGCSWHCRRWNVADSWHVVWHGWKPEGGILIMFITSSVNALRFR